MRALIVCCLVLLVAGGCAGGDPTAPRDVDELQPQTVPSGVSVGEQDAGTATRGLACAAQEGPVRLCGAATDNYKASYNENPAAIEARSWLAIDTLEIGDQTYRIADGHELAQSEVRLVAVDGSGEVIARARVESPGDMVTMRVGPQRGLWGPLLTLGQAPVRAGAPARVTFIVDGRGRVDLTYEHDPALADAPDDSLEHRGPGGRWRVGRLLTQTNLELGWE